VNTPRRSLRAIALAAAGTLALLAADLGSKSWASETLSEERAVAPPPQCVPGRLQRAPLPSVVVIEGYLEMQYAENCGAAFGIGNDWSQTMRRAVFIPAALLAAFALFWMFARGTGGPLFAWSVPFVVSGAVGNLVDRIRYGYVVDFIRFHVYDEFEYPTFNVADIAIVVGVALLVLDGFRKGGDTKASMKASDDESAKPARGSKKKKAKRALDAPPAETAEE
jgi:signal peptidase II